MSSRNTILENFKTMGLNIKETNGFTSTVVKCERKFTFWDQVQEFPHLMVLGGDEAFEDTLDNETGSWMDVRIKGYTQDKENPEVPLCNIIADIVKALNNPTYNPNAAKTLVSGVKTDEGWLHSESEGLGMFEVGVKVFYKFSRTNP